VLNNGKKQLDLGMMGVSGNISLSEFNDNLYEDLQE
jgi:hypothetical protein